MEQSDIVISPKQAKIFARVIYKSVSAYIQTHQQEYEQFLLLEQKRNDAHEENQSPY